MSDSTVIDDFVGEYQSDGETTSTHPDKLQYYPRKGVKLALDKVVLSGVMGGAYAKIRIKPDSEPFGGRLALERAVFRVHEGDLVAADMEIAPGMLLKESLKMTKNVNGKKEMTHTLNFSDGSLGTWICKT